MSRWVETTITRETEDTLYICSKCDFRTSYKAAMQVHYAQEHCVKRQRVVGKIELCWFEDKDDAGIWGDYTGCPHKATWSGPGWYALIRGREESEDRPVLSILSVRDGISFLRAELEGTKAKMKALEEFLEKES